MRERVCVCVRLFWVVSRGTFEMSICQVYVTSQPQYDCPGVACIPRATVSAMVGSESNLYSIWLTCFLPETAYLLFAQPVSFIVPFALSIAASAIVATLGWITTAPGLGTVLPSAILASSIYSCFFSFPGK